MWGEIFHSGESCLYAVPCWRRVRRFLFLHNSVQHLQNLFRGCLNQVVSHRPFFDFAGYNWNDNGWSPLVSRFHRKLRRPPYFQKYPYSPPILHRILSQKQVFPRDYLPNISWKNLLFCKLNTTISCFIIYTTKQKTTNFSKLPINREKEAYMDKEKIIEQIVKLLQSASAVQCSLALTFVKHMVSAP